MCIYTRHGDTLTAAERPLYGTKRLGELRQQIKIGVNGLLLNYNTATIGFRHYELTDHLGNVIAVVSDRKTLSADSVYYPVVISATDYYPFGYPITDRSSALGGYRYGFNGKENDNEIYGDDAIQNYGFRMYDTRIVRFWGVDPITKDYPMLTPFQFASCSPVLLIDVDGLEGIENTIGYTSNGVPFYFFNARQSTYVKPITLPEVELKTTIFRQSTKQNTPYQGEIRPAPSEYAKAWAESAGYFGAYIYLDPIVRATAAGGLSVTTGLFGQYVASNILPYAVKGGGEFYSLGLKIYNNPWGKRMIGIGLGYVGHKQEWSPDVTYPDPTIGTYSLLFQFLFDTWGNDKTLFDDKRRLDTNTSHQNTNDNAKPNNQQ